jgi:hypothetical protein
MVHIETVMAYAPSAASAGACCSGQRAPPLSPSRSSHTSGEPPLNPTLPASPPPHPATPSPPPLDPNPTQQLTTELYSPATARGTLSHPWPPPSSSAARGSLWTATASRSDALDHRHPQCSLQALSQFHHAGERRRGRLSASARVEDGSGRVPYT